VFNPSIQENSVGIFGVAEILSPVFRRAAGEEFQEQILKLCLEDPSVEDGLTILEDYSQLDCWLIENGQAGFAISIDRELINVFSRSSGLGSQAVEFAQRQYRYLHLNCFEGPLQDFYARRGFQEYNRERNWFDHPQNPRPDVVYMNWERK